MGDELTIKNSDGLVPGATPAVIKHCRDPINPGGGGAALALKADLASPALTGNPTAPTQAPGDDSTRIATTAFVEARASAIDGGTA